MATRFKKVLFTLGISTICLNIIFYLLSSTHKIYYGKNLLSIINLYNNYNLQNSNNKLLRILSENSTSVTATVAAVNEISSMCSIKATKYGTGQKVVSFSLFKKKDLSLGYLPGVQTNFKEIRKLYPGWVVRLYTNVNYDELGILKALEDYEPDFFICNTTCLPGLGDVANRNGMLWRFFPIGDPTVDIFIVRDSDSVVTIREASAVHQWLESDKVFHTMRDHPLHNAVVMGGLWGAKNIELDNKTRREILSNFTEGRFIHQMNDQGVLAKVLYSNFKSKFMVHDSYLCQQMKDSIPFPTRRQDLHYFLGGYRLPNNITVASCPIACRPSYGKDWIYC